MGLDIYFVLEKPLTTKELADLFGISTDGLRLIGNYDLALENHEYDDADEYYAAVDALSTAEYNFAHTTCDFARKRNKHETLTANRMWKDWELPALDLPNDFLELEGEALEIAKSKFVAMFPEVPQLSGMIVGAYLI